MTLSGRDHYLGPHGTKTSHREYDRLVAEWLARGRSSPSEETVQGFTLVELMAADKRFAREYYRKKDAVTNEYTAKR